MPALTPPARPALAEEAVTALAVRRWRAGEWQDTVDHLRRKCRRPDLQLHPHVVMMAQPRDLRTWASDSP